MPLLVPKNINQFVDVMDLTYDNDCYAENASAAEWTEGECE